MANSYDLAQQLKLTSEPITGNGTFTLWKSDVQDNIEQKTKSAKHDSLRCVIRYNQPEPVNASFQLQAVIESSNGADVWVPVAHQFAPFSRDGQANTRIIQLQPNLSIINQGREERVDVARDYMAARSLQAGSLGRDFRVRILCYETSYGRSNAFQSVTVDVFGETYRAT